MKITFLNKCTKSKTNNKYDLSHYKEGSYLWQCLTDILCCNKNTTLEHLYNKHGMEEGYYDEALSILEKDKFIKLED